jgi:hypothetical protein
MYGWGEVSWGTEAPLEQAKANWEWNMTGRQPRHSREEFARRGQEIYDQIVRPALRPEDENKFVAIDIESGNYEMDADDYTAVDRLYKRLPDAQPWLMRVGHPAAYQFGLRSFSVVEPGV